LGTAAIADLFERPGRRREMFGSDKKKIQLKSVEDYLRTQEVLNAGPESTPPKRRATLARAKSLVGPFIGVLFILLLVAAALSQFNGLRSEIAAVKAERSDDLQGLKLQVTELAAKAEKSEKQAALLAENISRLERELGAEKSARAEEAARRAAMVAAGKAKKKR